MSQARETHYEVLGVRRDARPADISRAHERLLAEFRKATTPPDPRRETRVAEAFAVLSDPQRRSAYDDELAQAVVEAPRRHPVVLVAGIAVVAVAAVAAYFVFAPASPPPGRAVKEIQADASRSVGRVQVVDLGGKAAATGIAFTVATGIMVTTCEGLSPGAQVTVTIAPRSIPARVVQADEALGLCKLAVDGAGSWPLALKGVAPKVGDRVYATLLDATGEVVLAEGEVKRVRADGGAEIVEAGVPASAPIGGRPLLDAWGRVLAVATAAQPGGGAVRHLVISDRWSRESPPEAPTVRPPAPAESAPAAPPAGDAPPVPALPPGMSREKAEDLAGKLRPPPTVPGNI